MSLARWFLRVGFKDSSLGLLLFALIVGVGAVTTTGLLADRIERALAQEGATFLGADLVIRSPRAIDDLPATPLRSAQALEFTTMASAGDAFQLITVRAIDTAYPLRGQVRIAPHAGVPGWVRPATPPPRSIYVEARLLGLMNAQIGDAIDIGDARFRIAGLITEEPGQTGSLFSFAPSVLMRIDEVDATGVVQPGSRVQHLYQFAGDPAAVAQFRAAVKPRLDPTQRLRDAADGNSALKGAYEKSARYARLAGLASLMLALVAIALAAQRQVRARIDEAALLRCLGLTAPRMLGLYLGQWLLIGLVGSGLGVLLGVGLQALLGAWLLPTSLALAASLNWQPAAAGLASGLIALFGASLPTLIGLARVPPLRVLRRDLPAPRSAAWASAGFALLLTAGLTVWHAGDARLAAVFLAALLGLTAVLAVLARIALSLGARVARHAPGALKLGLSQLARHRLDSLLQLGALALALFLLGLLWAARDDLVSGWRAQLPADAPNHFLLNITPEQRDEVAHFLQTRARHVTELYPMVRGRLVSRNGKPIEATLPADAEGIGALRRELNLTQSAQLPANNRIVAGRWFGAHPVAEISVESELASDLGLALGDVLGFQSGDQTLSATVTSFRHVEWASLEPNFFVMFAPGQLDHLPTSYLVGARIDDPGFVPAFVQAFPGVAVVAFDRLIAQLRGIVERVARAIVLLLGFLLAAGLAVVAASLAAGLDARRRECVLMRALGADRSTLQRALTLEFVVIGALAGLIGAAAAESSMALLAREFLEISPRLHAPLWLTLPPFGALLALAAGLILTRGVTRTPPIQALRAA